MTELEESLSRRIYELEQQLLTATDELQRLRRIRDAAIDLRHVLRREVGM